FEASPALYDFLAGQFEKRQPPLLQSVSQLVEPLQEEAQAALGIHESTARCQALQFLAFLVKQQTECLYQMSFQMLEMSCQFLSSRAYDFSRGGRSRSPQVGDKICNRKVGLMAHCRNNRNSRFGDCSCQGLFIEGP